MNNFIKLIEDNLSHKKGQEFIEEEIRLLFLAISNTNKIEDAELIFNNLEDIQIVLAKSIFKDRIIVTPFLKDFVYDFDRIDDFETRLNLFEKLKSRRTNFHSKII